MKDTIVAVCESSFGFKPSVILENGNAFHDIDELTLEEKTKLKYRLESVNILGVNEGSEYLLEYSDNLEKYILDNGISFNEAVENIAEHYDIPEDSITIVVDESCSSKLDLVTLAHEYNVKRK